MHKHHIIPKHAGGTNDPSNIEVVTIEEHAERHRILFETHGRWQDEWAYHLLSGQKGKEEMMREICQRNGLSRKGIKLGPRSPEQIRNLIAAFGTPETKTKRSLANKGKNNPMYGVTPKLLSSEGLENCRLANLGKQRALGYKYTQEQREARTKLQRGSKRSLITCPHCHQIGGSNNMKRWHFDNCKLKEKV